MKSKTYLLEAVRSAFMVFAGMALMLSITTAIAAPPSNENPTPNFNGANLTGDLDVTGYTNLHEAVLAQDTLQVVGSIMANTNISAAGTVTTEDLTVHDTLVAQDYTFLGTSGTSYTTVNGPIDIVGPGDFRIFPDVNTVVNSTNVSFANIGTVDFNGIVDFTDATVIGLDAGGQAGCSDNCTFNTITVLGLSELQGDVNVGRDLLVMNNIDGANIYATTNISAGGNLQVGGTLRTSRAATFNGTTTFNDSTTFNGWLKNTIFNAGATFNNWVVFGSTVAFNYSAAFNSTATIIGSAILNGNIYSSDGPLTFTDDIELGAFKLYTGTLGDLSWSNDPAFDAGDLASTDDLFVDDDIFVTDIFSDDINSNGSITAENEIGHFYRKSQKLEWVYDPNSGVEIIEYEVDPLTGYTTPKVTTTQASNTATKKTVKSSCLPDDIMVSCGGYMTNIDGDKEFRGAWQSGSNECTAAGTLKDTVNLFSNAYCFSPDGA